MSSDSHQILKQLSNNYIGNSVYRFSSNSEANVSEFDENLKTLFLGNVKTRERAGERKMCEGEKLNEVC